MILWVVFACLTAVVVVFLAAPFFKRDVSSPSGANEVELYKAQLREVDTDVSRGVLSEAEARDIRVEVSRRLLSASETQSALPHEIHFKNANQYTAALAVVVTSLTLGLYLAVGSPQTSDQPLLARLESPTEANKIDAMIAKVEARLRTHPDDAAGWNVIAPVYLRQQRFEDAAEAFRKAMALGGETSERLAGYGEASIMASDGVATAIARSALQKALQQNPGLLRARFFLALADENQGDKAAAREGYQTILKADLNPEWRRAIEAKVAALDGVANGAAPAPADQAERQNMIEGMVAGLADRLGKNGGEVADWLRLVRAYSVLGKKDDAMAAVEKAKAQYAGNLDALKQISDFALAMGLKS